MELPNKGLSNQGLTAPYENIWRINEFFLDIINHITHLISFYSNYRGTDCATAKQDVPEAEVVHENLFSNIFKNLTLIQKFFMNKDALFYQQ